MSGIVKNDKRTSIVDELAQAKIAQSFISPRTVRRSLTKHYLLSDVAKNRKHYLSDPDINVLKETTDGLVSDFISLLAHLIVKIEIKSSKLLGNGTTDDVADTTILKEVQEIADTFISTPVSELNSREIISKIQKLQQQTPKNAIIENGIMIKLLVIISGCARLEAYKEFAAGEGSPVASPVKTARRVMRGDDRNRRLSSSSTLDNAAFGKLLDTVVCTRTHLQRQSTRERSSSISLFSSTDLPLPTRNRRDGWATQQPAPTRDRSHTLSGSIKDLRDLRRLEEEENRIVAARKQRELRKEMERIKQSNVKEQRHKNLEAMRARQSKREADKRKARVRQITSVLRGKPKREQDGTASTEDNAQREGPETKKDQPDNTELPGGHEENNQHTTEQNTTENEANRQSQETENVTEESHNTGGKDVTFQKTSKTGSLREKREKQRRNLRKQKSSECFSSKDLSLAEKRSLLRKQSAEVLSNSTQEKDLKMEFFENRKEDKESVKELGTEEKGNKEELDKIGIDKDKEQEKKESKEKEIDKGMEEPEKEKGKEKDTEKEKSVRKERHSGNKKGKMKLSMSINKSRKQVKPKRQKSKKSKKKNTISGAIERMQKKKKSKQLIPQLSLNNLSQAKEPPHPQSQPQPQPQPQPQSQSQSQEQEQAQAQPLLGETVAPTIQGHRSEELRRVSSEDLSHFVCRICEYEVPIEQMEEHMNLCSKMSQPQIQIECADKRLLVCAKRAQRVLNVVKWKPAEATLLSQCYELSLRARKVATDADTQLIIGYLKLLNQLLSDAENSNQDTEEPQDEGDFYRSDPKNNPLSIAKAVIRQIEIKKEAMEEVAKIVLHSPRGVLPLTPKGHEIPTVSDFTFIKPIAKGGYSRVYLARKNRTGDLYAIKVLKKSFIRGKNAVSTILAEKKILEIGTSPFIVKMFYSFQTANHLFLVMEFLPGGDCYSLLKNQGRFGEAMVKMYLAETVVALEELHSKGIVHRDLKPDNMLISATGHIKLTDFGLSKIGITRKMKDSLKWQEEFQKDLEEEGEVGDGSEGVPGTPDYLAPEVLLGTGHGKAVDWWALGCVGYEFLMGAPPFCGCCVEEIFQRILSRDIIWPDVPSEYMSVEAKDLIDKLLQIQVEDRLGYHGVEEIKNHPFFEGVNWSDFAETKHTPIFIPNPDHEEDLIYFMGRNEDYPLDETDTFLNSVRKDQEESSKTVCSPRSERAQQDDGFASFNSVVLTNLQHKNKKILRQISEQDVSSFYGLGNTKMHRCNSAYELGGNSFPITRPRAGTLSTIDQMCLRNS